VFDRFADGITLDIEAMTDPAELEPAVIDLIRDDDSDLVADVEALDELVPA
jgi:hypothetical protein